MAASLPYAIRDDRPYSLPPERTERLPFRLRLADGDTDLARIAALRAEAYGRHIPWMVDTVARPEREDLRPESLILLAESLSTGDVLGSVRLIHNGHTPLKLEQDFPLPEALHGRFAAEASRLAVRATPEARQAALALMKGVYECCMHAGIEELLITARSPMDRVYLSMQFDDVLQGRKFPFPPVGNVPHGVYRLPVRQADQRWRESGCPMYRFMGLTEHPDIEISPSEVRQRFGAIAVNVAARNEGYSAALP